MTNHCVLSEREHRTDHYWHWTLLRSDLLENIHRPGDQGQFGKGVTFALLDVIENVREEFIREVFRGDDRMGVERGEKAKEFLQQISRKSADESSEARQERENLFVCRISPKSLFDASREMNGLSKMCLNQMKNSSSVGWMDR